MHVYDFDKTIYRGDSTTHFYLYCLRKQPSLSRFLPRQGIAFLRFLFGRIDKTACKQIFYTFLQGVPHIEKRVEDFWRTHKKNIMPWYLQQHQAEDVVISASPQFLLAPICQQLGISHLIASRVHPKTGKYTGLNCYGEEKVKRFHQEFGETAISKFYSDSLSDTPLAKLSEHSFLIRNQAVTPWQDYRPSKTKKIKVFFCTTAFLKFVCIGIINTINSVLLSFFYSLFWQPNLAFCAGYITSLLISYWLNSRFTFQEALSWEKCGKFCLSYLPNFVIQNTCVWLIYNRLGQEKLLAYIIAGILGVPLTFAIMRLFAFRKNG